MRYLAAAHTDVGITKKVNQDAFCLKVAKNSHTRVVFAVMCDGMGGLLSGELASAFVVNAFSSWFENEFPSVFKEDIDLNSISKRWNEIVTQQNQKIIEFGKTKGFSLGTTLTGLLMFSGKFLSIQVGDSRLYRIDQTITQISEDQTVLAMELEKNLLTKEQAENDTRQNVLLQCVGASKTVVPDFKIGVVKENDVFLLCTDGFRHQISEDEMLGVLAPILLTSEKMMKKSLVDLVDLNKTRKENDNISALLVKAIR